MHLDTFLDGIAIVGAEPHPPVHTRRAGRIGSAARRGRADARSGRPLPAITTADAKTTRCAGTRPTQEARHGR
jgi:hypothetical protein